MSQFYIDPSREGDEHALPDGEVFYAKAGEWQTEENEPNEAGWYWQVCLPGCLPDSEPCGPFESVKDAIADAQGWYE